MPPYQYDVERKTGSAPPVTEVPAPQELAIGEMVVGALIGLPAGLAVGWLLGDQTKRGRRAGRRGETKAPRGG